VANKANQHGLPKAPLRSAFVSQLFATLGNQGIAIE